MFLGVFRCFQYSNGMFLGAGNGNAFNGVLFS